MRTAVVAATAIVKLAVVVTGVSLFTAGCTADRTVVDDAALADETRTDWLAYGRTYREQRF
ncbi:MAG: hypothetical protein JSW43_04315, partial [Gemmatimonadota bacterium]